MLSIDEMEHQAGIITQEPNGAQYYQDNMKVDNWPEVDEHRLSMDAYAHRRKSIGKGNGLLDNYDDIVMNHIATMNDAKNWRTRSFLRKTPLIEPAHKDNIPIADWRANPKIVCKFSYIRVLIFCVLINE